MRIFFVIFCLFCTATLAAAQPPVINLMQIDETKGELQIFGEFGPTPGIVWCDSIPLQVKIWSDTLIKTAISNTGRGSVGPVEIGARGYRSEKRMITKWASSIGYNASLGAPGGSENADSYFTLYWRLDLHSILKKGGLSGQLSISATRPSKTSQYYSYNYYHGGPTGSPNRGSSSYVDSNYKFTGYYDSNGKKIVFNIGITNFGGSSSILYQLPFTSFRFDSEFLPITIDTSYELLQGALYQWSYSCHPLGTLFPPPVKAFALQNNPSLIGPNNGGKNIGYADAYAVWNSLNLMDSYRLQLALDSSFSITRYGKSNPQTHSTILDTTVNTLSFNFSILQPNTTYYWRVAGINSEGQSRWSDIWHFTTGSNADVTLSELQPEFSVYPNPASDKITISYLSDESTSFALYDQLGRTVRTTSSPSGQHQTQMNTRGLAAGNYVLVMRADATVQRATVCILPNN
jgi:hypothetical protein